MWCGSVLVGAAEVLALLLVLYMPLAQSASPAISRECSVFLFLVIALRLRLSTIFLCVFSCCHQQRGDSLRALARPSENSSCFSCGSSGKSCPCSSRTWRE